MANHLDNGDDFFIPRDQAVKEITIRDAKIARMMSDHGRMLWQDDVEGHCPNPEICFEYGQTVRCSPCAIKQANAAGVTPIEPENVYLPEVSRLNREISAKDQKISDLKKIIATIPESIREKIKEVNNDNSYWGVPSRRAYPDAPEILKEIEEYIKSTQDD